MIRTIVAASICAAVVLPSTADAQDQFASAAGDIVITPLAHASVRVDFNGRTIYVDPWSSAHLDGAPPASLIVVTDADAGSHHLDVTGLARVRGANAVVVIPQSGKAKVPDGVVMPNGAAQTFGDVGVEAIAAYDLTPGDPFHQKGVANGYLLTLGGTRVFFAGVTECVPEIKALRNVAIAFMPMNLPNGRMTPAAVADCVRSFNPKIVYPYHYDQGYIARIAGRGDASGAAAAAASVQTLAETLRGVADVRSSPRWYPLP